MTKKVNDNEKQIDGTVLAVLKFNMHCNSCAQKVVKFVGSLNGVVSVSREENDWKKITVVSKVDPAKLREIVAVKYNKNVELISRGRSSGDGEHKKQEKQRTDIVKDENDHKKVTTTVLKVSMNCWGCVKKIQKLVEETEGFMEMSIDKINNLVTVKGTMDMNMLTMMLKKKMKRHVEIVQTKRKENDGVAKKTGSQGPIIVQGNVGGGNKRKGNNDDGERKQNGVQGPTVAKGKSGGGKKGKGGDGDRAGEDSGGGGSNYRMEYFASQGQYTYPQYVNRSEYTFNYMQDNHMFNDENPNACVVM